MRSAILRGVAVLCLGVVACRPVRPSQLARNSATIVFANDSGEQAEVFASVTGTERVRLGTVMAGRSDQLRVPASLLNRGLNVTITVNLLARRATPQTPPVAIRSGDRIDVRLSTDGRTLLIVPPRP
jgi:hypothetical protein